MKRLDVNSDGAWIVGIICGFLIGCFLGVLFV